MRGLVGLILMFAVVAAFADNLGVSKVVIGGAPYNSVAWRLTDNTIDTTLGRDSLAIAGYNTYGPIPVKGSGAAGTSSALYFDLYTKPLVVASGDSVQIAYQQTATATLADTSATWTVLDSLFSSGIQVTAPVSLAATVGNFIWFKVTNVDATAAELAKQILCILKY